VQCTFPADEFLSGQTNIFDPSYQFRTVVNDVSILEESKTHAACGITKAWCVLCSIAELSDVLGMFVL